MSSTDDLVRSFGMSGLLLTDDLKGVEEQFGVELGHVSRVAAAPEEDYYTQFELAVRNEAAEMSAHYRVFYCLETSIRKLITETLFEAHGAAWWDSGCIPENIALDVKNRIKTEIESGVTQRSDAHIDYTTFGELSNIIGKNWDLFTTIFKNRQAVDRIMKNLNILRGPIAHCCPLADDEIVRLRLSIRDWFRMIG